MRKPAKENTKTKGERTEAIILAELLKRGYVVLLPFGDNQRYDFVVEYTPGKFSRVQCKTARLKNGALSFNTSSVIRRKGKWTHPDYKGDADFFMVYSPDLDKVYKVPIKAGGSRGCTLRVDPPKRKTKVKVRWAKTFEI